MRIVLNDAKMDAAAARLSGVQAGLSSAQGRMTPGLSAGAPPEIKGQVDAAVAEARSAVARVAGRCPSRALELRRRAILARLAGGDIRGSDLVALRAISAKQAALNARVGNGKVDNGGPFDVLKAFAGGVKDASADVAGAIGDNAGEVGHGVLDLAGLIPLFGEPADGINALIYAAEGDKTNAALSAAGMVPLLGWGATGGKIGNKIRNAADAGGGGGRAKGPGNGPRRDPADTEEHRRRVQVARAERISPARAEHILQGERLRNGRYSGGHRWPGRPGKSVFPRSWSDDRILDAVADIASEKGRIPAGTQPGGREFYEKMKGGVRIRVVVDADGRVITAFPLNTTRNAP